MNSQPRLFRFALPVAVALILSACAGAGPGWTYAPLGPSPAPTSAASASPAPSGSGGTGATITVQTTAANMLAFDPTTLNATAGTSVTVNYTNDSSLPHNIDFFSGKDQTSASLAKTTVAPGPGDVQSVTFTVPTTPGDYFFWCDVHTTSMTGILHVTP
jgi:plastocyanin